MIYFLSILNGLRFVTGLLGVAFLIVGVIYGGTSTDYETGSDQRLSLMRLAKRFWAFAVISAMMCALIPSQRSLRDAYIMVEASKVATAPNAEKVVKEASAKIDRIIELFKK